jgi:hypothetical protein
MHQCQQGLTHSRGMAKADAAALGAERPHRGLHHGRERLSRVRKAPHRNQRYGVAE